MNLSQLMDAFGPAIAEAVIRTYPPLYDAEARRACGHDLRRLLRRPLGAQADAIRAVALSLQTQGSTFVIGEMGCGKSLISIAAAYFAGRRRVLVLCPPHLVRKWRREVLQTLPNARATIVRSLTDLERWAGTLGPSGRKARAAPSLGIDFVICSREQAKLGYRWIPAAALRPVRDGDGSLLRDPSGAVERRVSCPACYAPVLDEEGVPLELADLRRKKRRCASCGGPLWQADRTGPRRVPLADHVRRRLRGVFDLLIADELHEYAARGSAQGLAAGTLADACGTTLALSGTLFGGYASALFYPVWRFSRQVRAQYGYRELMRWILRYGVVERITRLDPDARVADGRQSRRRAYQTRVVERPGVSPEILFHLLPMCVFIRMADVAGDLPPYDERVQVLGLDRTDLRAVPGAGAAADCALPVGTPAAPHALPDSGRRSQQPLSQAACYRQLASELRQAVVAALRSGSKRLLGTYLQALLGYPDACTRGETVVDAAAGTVLGHAPALPADRLYPKERALLELVQRERGRGRRVLVYLTHTEVRDISPRLQEVLAGSGLKVAVLKAHTVAPERREEWIARRVDEGIDALLLNARLVATGYDLLAFPTAVWYQTDYSTIVMRQASRRSWRPGQTRPVEVPFLVYGGTMQAQALALVAAKVRTALMVEGELPQEGLAALDLDDQDTLVALARRLIDSDAAGASDAGADGDTLEALFAAARAEDAAAEQYLVEGDWTTSPEPAPTTSSLAPAPLSPVAVAAPTDVWQPVLLPLVRTGSGGDAGGAAGPHDAGARPDSAVSGDHTGRVVTFETLAQLVRRPRARRQRVPAGQLALFGDAAAA
jgi:hypothetical protein